MPTPTLATGLSNNRGFSLIEILVVLVVIGIAMGFVFMAFGDFGQGRKIMTSAEQFVNSIKLAQQQAILETQTLGIKVNPHDYQFYRYNSKDKWELLTRQGPFAKHQFPDYLKVAGDKLKLKNRNNPDIIFNATGDITAFKFQFQSATGDTIATITNPGNGVIKVEKAHD